MVYDIHCYKNNFKNVEIELFKQEWEDDDRPAYDLYRIIVDDSDEEYEYSFKKLENGRWVLVTN